MGSVEYIRDSDVDTRLDEELRSLLALCFTEPADVVFRERRYFREPPQYRWYIRDDAGGIIAHVAVHEKVVEAAPDLIRIGGVGEVCVHPEFRGRGLVRELLSAAHVWLRSQHYPFTILFGDPRIYGSSGYVEVDNLFTKAASGAASPSEYAPRRAAVRQLADRAWPRGEVYLHGQIF